MKIPGGGDMGKLMKQAQKMQADMARAQAEIAALEVSGAAGGGSVTATVNGHLELVKISIAPDALESSDAELLEDLVLAAVKQAQADARRQSEARMAAAAGPMGGMMGLG